MKRILFVISIFALFLTSCSGTDGLDGRDGQDGGIFVAQSFERTIDLVSSNNFQQTLEIPLDIDLFESDMVLVYRLNGQAGGFDVWKVLPETIYTNNGQEFQYNFEHNFDFVTIFIDGPSTFNFNNLLPGDTLDQTFRIVILPVDFVNSKNIDVNNYGEVSNYIKQP
ncbi:dihydrolipoamide dehydrogenase [Lacinutrix sp.]|uniref:dihydrolipoamide dehydrogenase n=1 Tax=Lacinutrix sp. TaxID=1937692 RepID=UPI0025C716F2|nr:dihydrolipoamide dehydrogenase [Lacinutrix sp.]